MKKVLLMLLLLMLLVGCGSKGMTAEELVDYVRSKISYNVTYREKRDVIRIQDSIAKEVAYTAIIDNYAYLQWSEMKDYALDLYNVFDKYVKDNSDGIKTEFIMFDAYDEDIMLLLINENGVVYDVVDKTRNKK